MKRIAAAWALAAAPAFAQAPAGFSTTVPLTLTGTGSLHRVTLPEAVYRDAHADLSDVRVFNARREAVPIALASDPEAVRQAPASVPLTFFPVPSLEAAHTEPSAGRVRIRMSDGTEVSVDAGRTKEAAATVAAYVLDATSVKRPFHALRIDWDPSGGAAIVKVRVEGSDDLRVWHPMSSSTPLVHLEQSGRTLEQGEVLLNGNQARFLRLTWERAPLRLRGVNGEFPEEVARLPRPGKTVAGTAGDKPGEIVYDLGARVPVEALRLVPGDDTAVIPAAIYARRRGGGDILVANAVFYRLVQDGERIESPLIEIGRRASRYWVVRVDPDKGAIGATLPQLEARWNPGELVFVARGPAPFTLAFGNPNVHSALLPVGSLIPGYELHAEMRLPPARAGEPARTRALGGLWPEAWADVPPRQVALWAVLVVAVALLGVMAWRLRRQMK